MERVVSYRIVQSMAREQLVRAGKRKPLTIQFEFLFNVFSFS
jgi:hypothetical protein